MTNGNKVISLREAVARTVRDGDTVFVGGFGQCIPYAAAHEIVRQGRKDLTLCRSGTDILFDMMVAAGCVRKVIAGYVGNPGVGLAHAFRRAVQNKTIEVEDWTNFSMVLRLHAGALGVPFLPSFTLHGGDLPERIALHRVVCPYTGETLSAIPALRPDVAIIHAQRADRHGNVQMFGLTGDSVDGALASYRILATVEEIVPDDIVRNLPDRTTVPGFRVDAVCAVPWGAHPSYVEDHYGRDDDFYREWDAISRDEKTVAQWIEANIRATAGFEDYIASLPPARLDALEQQRKVR